MFFSHFIFYSYNDYCVWWSCQYILMIPAELYAFYQIASQWQWSFRFSAFAMNGILALLSDKNASFSALPPYRKCAFHHQYYNIFSIEINDRWHLIAFISHTAFLSLCSFIYFFAAIELLSLAKFLCCDDDINCGDILAAVVALILLIYWALRRMTYFGNRLSLSSTPTADLLSRLTLHFASKMG